MFEHLSFLLPAERLHETTTLVAFRHPRPAHKTHILIVPKAARPDVAALTADDAAFMVDLCATVGILAAQLDLKAYRLVTNGGAYQDVPQLHFHLIVDE